jgi:hypothetical protein
MENISYLLLGWFLGLLSPKIIKLIERPYQARGIKNGVFSELNEVKLRMALIVNKLAPQYFSLNKEMIYWLIPYIEEHERLYSDKTYMSEALKKLVEADEKDFTEMVSIIKQKDPEPGYRLIPYLLPFLESQISSLTIFNLSFQKDLIKIKVKISLLNELITTSRFYYDKTFENLSEYNHIIIKKNLANSYTIVAQTSKRLVEEIDQFISKYKNDDCRLNFFLRKSNTN